MWFTSADRDVGKRADRDAGKREGTATMSGTPVAVDPYLLPGTRVPRSGAGRRPKLIL
jgi:hypothetical protein